MAKNMNRKKFLAVLFLIAFFQSSLHAATFRNVIDSVGTFDGHTFTGLAFPSLNNNQQLSFEGATTGGVTGIFLADLSGPTVDLDVLVDTSGVYDEFDSFFNKINDNGLVAVHAKRDDGESEIFTVDTAGLVTPLVDTTGTFNSLSTDIDMNNSGTVAFFGIHDSGTSVRGIYTAKGTTPLNTFETIADHTGEFENFWIPNINDSGDVLYIGSDSDAEVGKLVVNHPGGGETIVKQYPFGNSSLPHDINDNGDVSYYFSGDSAVSIFNASDSSTDLIVDSSDGFNFGLPLPDMRINNSSQIAFVNQNRLILADADGFDILLEPGNSLFGSTVSSLYFAKSLNDLGEISFIYVLNSGVVGIAVASTTEPSADFDEDGDVDAEDYAVWDSAFGLNNTGDTDGDGDSDGIDFLNWQQQFTGNLSPAIASVQVPEPSGLYLLMLAVFMWCSQRAMN